MEEILEYRSAIERLCELKSNTRIVNSSIAHTRILTDVIITNAASNDRICILSATLSEELFDSIKNSKANTIVLLVNSIFPDGHWIFDTIRNSKKNINLYSTDKEVLNYFLCTSSFAFRYETNSSQSQAIACFNDPSICKKLLNYYEKLLDNSTLIIGSKIKENSLKGR